MSEAPYIPPVKPHHRAAKPQPAARKRGMSGPRLSRGPRLPDAPGDTFDEPQGTQRGREMCESCERGEHRGSKSPATGCLNVVAPAPRDHVCRCRDCGYGVAKRTKYSMRSNRFEDVEGEEGDDE